MNRYNHGFGVYFLVYQICILVWMTIGLGYLVMVIGFLTRGLRSKKITRLEKIVKQNIKNTHEKIWRGFSKDIGYLRRLMNELYMAKFKVSSFSFRQVRNKDFSHVTVTLFKRFLFFRAMTSIHSMKSRYVRSCFANAAKKIRLGYNRIG